MGKNDFGQCLIEAELFQFSGSFRFIIGAFKLLYFSSFWWETNFGEESGELLVVSGSKSLTCSRPYYSEFCPLKSWITLIVLDIEVYWIKRFFGEVKRKKKFVLRLSVPKEIRNLTLIICSLESRKSWTTIKLSWGLQIIIYILLGHPQQSYMKPRKLKINEKRIQEEDIGFNIYLLCLIQNDETRS